MLFLLRRSPPCKGASPDAPIQESNRFLSLVGRSQACRGLEADASAAALRSNVPEVRSLEFNDTNKNIRLRGDVYAGGCIPGELIQATRRAVMSACRAFFRRSYLSLPCGRRAALSR